VLVLLLAGVLLARSYWHRETPPKRPPAPAFEGDSTLLHETVIVPTLDTPAPPGKNIIWCASFELAWNHLRSEVVRSPVQIANAEAVAERLNASKILESDLVPESCFAAAGLVRDGIMDRIRNEMAGRFPGHQVPEASPDDVIVAYAFLRVAAAFTVPFFENDGEFAFTDAAGKRTPVASFGTPPGKRSPREPGKPLSPEQLPQQVHLLYAAPPLPRKNNRSLTPEFAIDLCRTTKDCQIIVAALPPRESLAATLDYLNSKIAATSTRDTVDFGELDVILVPNISWKIVHHFRELEGRDKGLHNPGFDGLWISKALQSIEFKLDRSGVLLESESHVRAAAKPTAYLCNRPFLVCVRRRGADRPFFVMWVANAKLLSKVSR
jgi:hypothetical protein